MADKTSEIGDVAKEQEKLILSPGKEFSYTGSSGRDRNATLVGYGLKEGNLMVNYLIEEFGKVGSASKRMEDLNGKVRNSEGESMMFGGKVRKSSGEIEDNWVYAGTDSNRPDVIIMVKYEGDNKHVTGSTRRVGVADFVQLNSPLEKFKS